MLPFNSFHFDGIYGGGVSIIVPRLKTNVVWKATSHHSIITWGRTLCTNKIATMQQQHRLFLRVGLEVWFGIWECASPQGLILDSLWCQFKWTNLTYSKKKKKTETAPLQSHKTQSFIGCLMVVESLHQF